MSDTVYHGPATPTLVPDVVNAYYSGHGDATFHLPKKSSSSPTQRATLKIFDGHFATVKILDNPDDGGGLRWIGTTGGDYVTFELNPGGSYWQMFDHFETITLRINKDNHQNIPAGAQRHVTSWHVIDNPAKLDFSNDVLTIPLPARMDLVWGMVPGKVTGQSGLAAEVEINGTLLEPNYTELMGGSAGGCSYTPWSTVGFLVGQDWTVKLFARNLETDNGTHVDARSEAWARFRWRY